MRVHSSNTFIQKTTWSVSLADRTRLLPFALVSYIYKSSSFYFLVGIGSCVCQCICNITEKSIDRKLTWLVTNTCFTVSPKTLKFWWYLTMTSDLGRRLPIIRKYSSGFDSILHCNLFYYTLYNRNKSEHISPWSLTLKAKRGGSEQGLCSSGHTVYLSMQKYRLPIRRTVKYPHDCDV